MPVTGGVKEGVTGRPAVTVKLIRHINENGLPG